MSSSNLVKNVVALPESPALPVLPILWIYVESVLGASKLITC